MQTRSEHPVAVNVTRSVVVAGQATAAAARLSPESLPAVAVHAGIGLPCANCRTYYPADMNACPICKSKDRVAPAAMAAEVPVTSPVQARSERVEDEREQYLKQLKSEAFATHTQIDPTATFRCCLDQNHNGTVEAAAVCHSCYSEVRQLADRLEAALHIDLKEAAQIVYDAVWADASDPSKTYQNAAAALLIEMRKRAGVGLLLGSNSPLTH